MKIAAINDYTRQIIAEREALKRRKERERWMVSRPRRAIQDAIAIVLAASFYFGLIYWAWISSQ